MNLTLLRLMILLPTLCLQAWKWSEGKEPGVLQNKVEVYDVPHEARELYEEELGNWIEEGWLLP